MKDTDKLTPEAVAQLHKDFEAELQTANETVYKYSLELARLKQALEVANAQQENLLHFISHEIKGYLTKGQDAFAGISVGDYGVVPDTVKTLAEAALAEMRRGVATVMNILDASNLKKGTVMFKKAPFSFKAAVLAVAAEQKTAADEKHLMLELHTEGGEYNMEGDEEKIREHVVRNLIDNAIKYTPSGTVLVELTDGGGKIHFSVKDSGVGITPEDMKRLFTEGGHGAESIKTNVHSTGYGLYIAKQIVEAHGGKIWAESDGAGKGSRFVVQFPVTK